VIRLPNGVDIINLIDDLRIYSWEACDIMLFYSRKLEHLNTKSEIIKSKINNEPVTLADLEVNSLIMKRFNKKYGHIGWSILSEENENKDFKNNHKTLEWLWVLDPLDGTKDFIQGTGNYAMHLALNYHNKPVLGIVLIPERNELWVSNGKDCWVERRDGSRKQPTPDIKKSIEDMKLVTSKNNNNETLRKLNEKIQFKKFSMMGSVGCKIASILRGENDIYISLSIPGNSFPKDWDFAAPEAILKAAGGAITDIDNNELIYNKSKFEQSGIIIASNNKSNHGNICFYVKEIIKNNNLYPFKD
tara:strand:- start:678 stop:1586 length:909 start_codon:yes stop_codon:yes gene_type:complete